jgi:hypothetical protein
MGEDGPIQSVSPLHDLQLPVIDLHHIPTAEQPAELQRQAAVAAANPSILNEGRCCGSLFFSAAKMRIAPLRQMEMTSTRPH